MARTAAHWFGLAMGLALAGPAAAQQGCQARANDTPDKLLACIQRQDLWTELTALQTIATQNPDKNGHGNRDTGTSGYKASVDYVANLMTNAGYKVTIQPYMIKNFALIGTPGFSAGGAALVLDRDWDVVRLSGSGTLSASVQMAGGLSHSGCAKAEFDGFVPGHIALIARGACSLDDAVANAQAAGAAGVIVYTANSANARPEKLAGGLPARMHLIAEAQVPVVAVAHSDAGDALYRRALAGAAPQVRLDVHTDTTHSVTDYNVIADSPYGDPNHVVVVEGHLDSIYGAGILDNGSGSVTILDIALNLAHTSTLNQLRYVWFGGEEIGLFGSRHYTKTLSAQALQQIVFDIDADVTATPNFDFLIANPQYAHNVTKFPPNVVPGSQVGTGYFTDYFKKVGLPVESARFGNDGTDSNSFALVGVPNTGILTQQDCCKGAREVKVWGGFLGNYEGTIPSSNGGCVDLPHRWCDNLSNNDPVVFEAVSKAVAYVTFKLANDPTLGGAPHR